MKNIEIIIVLRIEYTIKILIGIFLKLILIFDKKNINKSNKDIWNMDIDTPALNLTAVKAARNIVTSNKLYFSELNY